MITIEPLKNHPQAIATLANIWHEVLGKIWMPDVTIELVITRFLDQLKVENLPITFVALDGNIPVGMCSVCENDGIRPDLKPWVADLVVDPKYQKQGVGKMLIDTSALKAKDLGFEKLYLFAFDPTIPNYYERLGWKRIDIDEFHSHPVTVMEIVL